MPEWLFCWIIFLWISMPLLAAMHPRFYVNGLDYLVMDQILFHPRVILLQEKIFNW